MQEQKSRQPAGRKSSFSPNAISGAGFLRARRRPPRAERSRRHLSAGFPADAQMPTAWALREPGAALGEMDHTFVEFFAKKNYPEYRVKNV